MKTKRSIRVRATLFLSAVYFIVFFLLLLIFIINSLHEVIHRSRISMKEISKGMFQILNQDRPASELFHEIAEAMEFIDSKGNYSYAIYKGESLLYTTQPDWNPSTEKAIWEQSEGMFLNRVESGNGLDDALANWHFVYHVDQDGYSIYITNISNFELAERFIEGLVIAVILSLLLAVPIGWLVSKRFVNPVYKISGVLEQVWAGDLKARATPMGTRDELAALIDTLNRTLDKLEDQASRMRSFCGNVAHELNTPLTVLRGNLELCLARERNAEAYTEVLHKCHEEISDLSRMVNSLLLLASSPGLPSERFEKVDLSIILNEFHEPLALLAEQKQIKLSTDLMQEAFINGDPTLLPRLFYNLIQNAIRYSPKDGAVDVSLQRHDDSIIFEVQDQGPGIPGHCLDRIFEPFFQVDPSRAVGTGLGLALAKWVADHHDAQISVESKIDRGTTFRVRFRS